MSKRFLAFSFLLTTTILLAQRNNSSPYSYFGIGEEFSPKTVEQISMGGIGAAYTSNRYLNFVNPAANAYLRYATYGFGVLNNDLTVEGSAGSQSSTATSISYVALGFPIGKKAGFTAGLQPVSSIGYSLFNTIADANGNTIEATQFQGSGGLNRIYGAFGIQVYKGISLGLELDYTFGNIENSITNQRAGVSLATKYKDASNIRGGSVKLGAHYKTKLNEKLTLDAGIVSRLSNTLNTSGNESLYSLSFSAGTELPRDTLSSGATKGTFKYPVRTTIGAGIGQVDKWHAGIDYEFEDAPTTTGVLNVTGTSYRYENSSRLSIGGFYLPKINSISSYFQRVTYRAGVRFEKTGLLVDGSGAGNFTPIDDFGINLGLGLPLGNRLSNLNVGLEYGQKGTTNNNLIKENYFNVRISLSLNDTWFRKRKID